MPMNFEYRVVRLDELTFESSRELAAMYKLSPCVWQENGRFELLLRVVNYSENPAEKVARIHRGSSVDGLCFVLDDEPAIAPGPDLPGSYDSGGCEDPTIARVDGTYYVYYSGWNEHLKRGELLLAGRSRAFRHTAEERGSRSKPAEQVTNPKKGGYDRARLPGRQQLAPVFEYANEEGKSKIGLARSASTSPARPAGDSAAALRASSAELGLVAPEHRSDPRIGDRKSRDVLQWRNGERAMAHRMDRVRPRLHSRCSEVGRPADFTDGPRRREGDSDIAFAASSVRIADGSYLYYSVADQYVMRATLSSD